MGDTAILRPLQITEERFSELIQTEREYKDIIRQSTNAYEIAQLNRKLNSLQQEVARLSTELKQQVIAHTSAIKQLETHITRLEQPINGRSLASTVETYILDVLLELPFINSLQDAFEFLNKVKKNELEEDEQELWDKKQPDVRAQIIDTYNKNSKELRQLRWSIIAVKKVGNEIAHPSHPISKPELFEFYQARFDQGIDTNTEKLDHLKRVYNYLETHNIPLQHQRILRLT